MKLLAIGNSLAENPLTFFRDCFPPSLHETVHVSYATIGGCTLERHANLAEFTGKHKSHKTYQTEFGGVAWPGSKGRIGNLQDVLQLEEWDVITLNQGSIVAPRRESWEPWLGQLHTLILRFAPKSNVYLNMTWAYRDDAPYLVENGLTGDSMYSRLRENYRFFAEKYHYGVIPTGEAIQRYRRSRASRFDFPDPAFDYIHAKYPHLPIQKSDLSVGWHWQVNESPSGIPQLVLDPNHLNIAGCYLASCTWFGALGCGNPEHIAFVPSGLDQRHAGELRKLASDVTRSK